MDNAQFGTRALRALRVFLRVCLIGVAHVAPATAPCRDLHGSSKCLRLSLCLDLLLVYSLCLLCTLLAPVGGHEISTSPELDSQGVSH